MAEEKVQIESEDQSEAINDLTPEEKEFAEKSGIIKSDKNDSEKDDGDTDDNTDEDDDEKSDDDEEDEDQGEEKDSSDPATFEDMENAFNKDQKQFHKNFTPNAKALYFKFKHNKRLRQEAQEEYENAKAEKEITAVKNKVYEKKLKVVSDLIERIDSGDDSITTADIRKAIELKKEIEESEDKGQKESSDNGKAKRQDKGRLAEKARNTEILGASKYPDFEKYVELANEVVSSDKDLAAVITNAYHDPEVDEDALVEKIVKIARINPKYGETKTDSSNGKSQKNIDRIVANSKKKKTSASISGGNSKKSSGYDDISAEDLARMSAEDFRKVPIAVREKLIKQLS